MDTNQTDGEKAWQQLHKNSASNIEQVLEANPTNKLLYGRLQPSRKLSKLDEPDMRDSAGEVGRSSLVMYSCGSLQMVEQRQGGQLELTYSRSLYIWNIALRTCWKRWTIGRGGERGSEISVLMARHDDDTYIYMNGFSIKWPRMFGMP